MRKFVLLTILWCGDDFPSSASRRRGRPPPDARKGRTAMTTDDRDLVARYRAGEYEAGRQLLDRHWHTLVKAAMPKLGNNWHDAEEAVVDAFAALAKDTKPIRNAEAWLRTVVGRKAVDLVRRRPPTPAGEPEESLPARDPGVERITEQRAFVALLQALDHEERRIMAAAVDDATTDKPALEQARALNLQLHAGYYPGTRRARQQAADARLLLHMLQSAEPCPGLLLACGTTPGQEGPGLTPRGRKEGLEHVEECDACQAVRDRVKHRAWVPGVVAAPSPELYDRIREVCDATSLKSTGTSTARQEANTGAERGSKSAGRRVGARGALAGAATGSARRRPRRRAGKALTASLAALLAAIVFANEGRGSISLPDISSVPGLEEITAQGGTSGESSSGNSTGGNGGAGGGGSENRRSDNGGKENVGREKGDSENGGSQNGGSENGGSENGGSENGGSGNGGSKKGGSEDGGSEDGGSENGGSENGGSENGGSENGGTGNGGIEDTTGPTVSLAGISTDALGQEVLDNHGSLMQTCGPSGTPTTYSVRVAASDPSGIFRLTLYIQHPTDGTYTSSSGVADGDAVRFDIPAYRTGPKPLETVQLRLYALAKDMNGNRTEADLGTLPLYECGEPG
ncbi:sigma factor [Streptomyces sp. NPDC101110]|uniref:RNA polymerase sigma factor n=1 Tax=Streptomyces sp. NPDC101110 TaxID=3366104 RepID=UPI0037F4E317